MRYSGLQFCAALIAVAGCATAQAPPTTPTPAPATVRAERVEAERAVRRLRSDSVRRLRDVQRVRADSIRGIRRAQRLVSDSAQLNRAALGLTLSQTGTKRDTLGIFISSVVEGGPAERAGIVEGDRIAAINGVDVRTTATDIEDSYLRGVAHRRFTMELRKLTAGQRANLRVWSGGRYRDVQIVAGRYADVYRNRRRSITIGDGSFVVPMPDVRVNVAPRINVAPGARGRALVRPIPIRPIHIEPMRIELENMQHELNIDLEKMEHELEGVSAAIEAATAAAAGVSHEALLDAEEGLLHLEELLEGEEPFFYDEIDGEVEIEAEDESATAQRMEELANEAVRQARETLGSIGSEIAENTM